MTRRRALRRLSTVSATTSAAEPEHSTRKGGPPRKSARPSSNDLGSAASKSRQRRGSPAVGGTSGMRFLCLAQTKTDDPENDAGCARDLHRVEAFAKRGGRNRQHRHDFEVRGGERRAD